MLQSHTSTFRRFLFDNIVIKINKPTCQYLLMNLRSFRREFITENDYVELCFVEDALNDDIAISEDRLILYKKMLDKKQILTKEQQRQYDDGRRIIYQQQVEEISPLITDVTISPTFACNFKCNYCYQRDFENKNIHMTRMDIDQICEYIQTFNETEHFYDGIQTVTLNGGECCQKENIDVINYILEKFGQNPFCSFKLYTNGSQITRLKDHIDFRKITTAQISLDGFDEIIPQINGINGPVFDAIISGIKYLAENCKAVRLACMLTPTLVEHMDDFVNILAQESILDYENLLVDFSVVSNFQKETVDARFLSLSDYARTKKRFREANYPRNVIFDLVRESQRISMILWRTNSKVIAREHTCNIFETRNIMFAPGGKVYWCLCTNQKTGEIGNYKQPTRYDRDRFMQYVKRSTNLMPVCNKCRLKYVCSGGCPLFAVAQEKKPNEGYCGLYGDPYFMEHLEDFL